MSDVFGIAAIQCAFAYWDKDPLESHIARIRDVKARFPWVKMVVLPELALCGADTKFAKTDGGETLRVVQSLAKETQLWIVPGSLYEQTSEGIKNVAPAIDPAGDVIAKASKLFPWTPYEKDVTPGEEFCVFDVQGVGKFGLCICYDMWFPETIRALTWLGAEVILHPTLTPTIDREIETVMARANAAFNQVYFVDVNAARPQGAGHSLIVDQDGRVLHHAGECTEIIPLEVDFTAIRRSRERGIMTLGQPLKSFRDSALRFPQYQTGAKSPALDALGPLATVK